MFKAKILVLGPCKSGKSVISNFLSDSTEGTSMEYHPTQGCRILEFELSGIQLGSGRNVNAEVEMWDCSGDQKFEACWPAIARDTNGILFVFNPDQSNHDKELETWYDYFVEQQAVRNNQCMALAHHKAADGNRDPPNLPSCMSKVQCIHSNIDDDGETLREEFRNYLSSLLSAMSEKREQEELSIMNSR